MTDEEIEKKFKLVGSLNCTNLVLFDRNNNIKKYRNECEILEEFFDYRLKIYQQRKNYMIKRIKQEFEKFSNQYRFISEIISGTLSIYNKKKDVVIKTLEERGYKTYQEIYDIKPDKKNLLV